YNAPSETSPDAVDTDAESVAKATATSPDAVSALIFPRTDSSVRSPLAEASLQSAYSPSAVTLAEATEACSREPDGNATSTTTAPRRGNENPRLLATDSVPLLKSTRTCSAALTSSDRDASHGRTSTTVSVRSVATSRTAPAEISTVAVIGCGVSKVGITCLLDRCQRTQPLKCLSE